jgi:hypothetical protein
VKKPYQIKLIAVNMLKLTFSFATFFFVLFDLSFWSCKLYISKKHTKFEIYPNIVRGWGDLHKFITKTISNVILNNERPSIKNVVHVEDETETRHNRNWSIKKIRGTKHILTVSQCMKWKIQWMQIFQAWQHWIYKNQTQTQLMCSLILDFNS